MLHVISFLSYSQILSALMEIIDWPKKSIGQQFASLSQPGLQPCLE